VLRSGCPITAETLARPKYPRWPKRRWYGNIVPNWWTSVGQLAGPRRETKHSAQSRAWPSLASRALRYLSGPIHPVGTAAHIGYGVPRAGPGKTPPVVPHRSGLLNYTQLGIYKIYGPCPTREGGETCPLDRLLKIRPTRFPAGGRRRYGLCARCCSAWG
jgi:hypothetical protein